MEAASREIELEGVDPRELYGAQECHLEQMREMHPELRISARGSSLKVYGSPEQTAKFEQRLEGLVAYYQKYGHLSPSVIEQAFSGSTIEVETRVDKDVIVFGNNGNIIRARTPNQQKLV